MKTLIVILVLFSSSLLAEDNLPAPFGIQLGAPVSDDLICKTLQEGTMFNFDIDENTTFKDHYKEYQGSWHGNCDLVVPKKNKKYDTYKVFVRGDDFIVTIIRAEKKLKNSEANEAINTKYAKNLVDFLINKYDLKRVMGSIYDCLNYEIGDKEYYKQRLDMKFINFCEQDIKIRKLNEQSKPFKIPSVEGSELDRNINEKAIENLKKQYELIISRNNNYLDRVMTIEECYLFQKIARNEYKKRKYTSEPASLEVWQNRCNQDVNLENEFFSIEIATLSNLMSITYNVKPIIYNYHEEDFNLLKEGIISWQEDLKKLIEKEKEKSSVDEDSL